MQNFSVDPLYEILKRSDFADTVRLGRVCKTWRLASERARSASYERFLSAWGGKETLECFKKESLFRDGSHAGGQDDSKVYQLLNGSKCLQLDLNDDVCDRIELLVQNMREKSNVQIKIISTLHKRIFHRDDDEDAISIAFAAALSGTEYSQMAQAAQVMTFYEMKENQLKPLCESGGAYGRQSSDEDALRNLLIAVGALVGLSRPVAVRSIKVPVHPDDDQFAAAWGRGGMRGIRGRGRGRGGRGGGRGRSGSGGISYNENPWLGEEGALPPPDDQYAEDIPDEYEPSDDEDRGDHVNEEPIVYDCDPPVQEIWALAEDCTWLSMNGGTDDNPWFYHIAWDYAFAVVRPGQNVVIQVWVTDTD